ncbi:MAG: S8 family serine peptidase [Spirulinaceae cyanobacterium SM2_1_0]|nr:S8 family serine peptidase [Spirulinaceae cyanobacterium SM2_1_0]
MKKLLLLALAVLGLSLALWNFQGLAVSRDYDTLILDFREDVPAAQVEELLGAIAQQTGDQPRLNSKFSGADNVYVVAGDRAALRELRRTKPFRTATEFIEPNYRYYNRFRPNDPDYSQQWNFQSINLEKAWDETKGAGVTVAVIDTGVSRVPDLKQTEFVPGYDFVHDSVETPDDVGHGTHVAGTIAQSTDNSYGVAGIAYEAKIMPLKVLAADGGGTVSDIAEAIKFAADHDATVINLSLGGAGESKLLEEAVNYAYDRGVVVVAAAGNENRNSASYPARYPHVISVAALDSTGKKADYSNFGAGVDIAAPGGGGEGRILQNTIDPETGEAIFASFQGTSMAAPHVAGVAALLKASGVEEPEQVGQILRESARTVTEDPLNHYGAGQLDAGAAVELARKGQFSPRDFFRWLRENGYLNLRFWFDGGVVALAPKLAMVLGSYLLAWLLRNYFPFGWSWSLASGLVAGSSGLFFLRGFYIFDLPQAPFRVLGSSIPELGGAVQGSTTLNPLFASVLIPLGLIALLLSHPTGKWFAVGTALGVASCLAISAVIAPDVWLLGGGWLARVYLLGNAALCFGLARLAVTGDRRSA